MRLALDRAREAAIAGEVPVGAVVTRGGEMLAATANRMRTGSDPTAHAEMVALREAARGGKVELLGETSFWERLGLADQDHLVRSLYTPAMLADLLEVDVAKIRQWHRMGLIRPERVIHRLPYFAYAEAASARRIHQLLESGVSADKLRTYCLYEAPSPEAIVEAARRANVPADEIVEVSKFVPAELIGTPSS